jgi:hypothetical protein
MQTEGNDSLFTDEWERDCHIANGDEPTLPETDTHCLGNCGIVSADAGRLRREACW